MLSPGPGPQSAPAAASAASGAATSGRSRWDSRSAFPRVSPALVGYGRLAGRSPPWHAGRGLDVYADQTLLDAIWGRAGRVPNAPSESPKGWGAGGIPASGRHLTTPRPGPRAVPGRPGLAWPGALLRRGLLRTPAPRRPPGPASLPGRGLGRSGPALPGGTAGQAAARRGAGGRRGRRRLPSGRAQLHQFGDQRGAHRNLRILVRASACRAASGGVGGRALLGPACRGRP